MSDSDSDDNNASDVEEFNDGFDKDLIGDEDDRKRLYEMTEVERERELFNRIEKREALLTRYRSESGDTRRCVQYIHLP